MKARKTIRKTDIVDSYTAQAAWTPGYQPKWVEILKVALLISVTTQLDPQYNNIIAERHNVHQKDLFMAVKYLWKE